MSHRDATRTGSDGLHEVRFWRVLAVIGLATTVVTELIRSLSVGRLPGALIIAALLPALGCFLVLYAAMRREIEQLRDDLDLLVPLGVVLLATRLLWIVGSIPPLASILDPSWEPPLIGSVLQVSLGALLTFAIWIGYAAWQTDLLRRRLGAEPDAPVAPQGSIPFLFWRSLGILCIGWGGLFIALFMAMVIAPAALAIAMAIMLAWTLVWNMLTAAILPCGLDRRETFPDAIRRGLGLSRRLIRRWWGPLIAQMILLGVIVIMRVSTHTWTNYSTSSHINVNTVWTGAYANGCKWYETYVDLKGMDDLPILSSGLEILFLLLAITIKMRVITTIHAAEQAEITAPADGPDPPVADGM